MDENTRLIKKQLLISQIIMVLLIIILIGGIIIIWQVYHTIGELDGAIQTINEEVLPVLKSIDTDKLNDMLQKLEQATDTISNILNFLG